MTTAVTLEHFKLIFVPHAREPWHLTDMAASPQDPRTGGEGRVGRLVDGSKSSLRESQMTGEQKKERRGSVTES